MAVSTREELKQWCLRDLGAPVVQINIAEEQLEDRIDEAIEYFQEYHWDGIERMYLSHQLTQEEIDNQEVEVPDYIFGIKRVMPLRSQSSSSNLFDVHYQLRLNDLYEVTNTSVVHYDAVMKHIEMMDQILNGYPQFEFNRLSRRLKLEFSKHKVTAGRYILLECYRALDPTDAPKMYNERWFKSYATALIKKNWGTNLKKFSGLVLPGGVTLDGKDMYLEALQEIKELEDELINKSAPLSMIIG